MFKKTRIKLTAWYLAIIMVISLLFSSAIYINVNTEFRRFERLQDVIRSEQGGRFLAPLRQLRVAPERLDPEMIQAARIRLLTTLGFINLSILLISGGAGYFLAGMTLKPIKKMVDEQNRFISDSSHEFRTPLTSLRSEIEVALRNKKITIADARRILESNLEEVLSLQVLSDSLLELAQNGSSVSSSSVKQVSVLDLTRAAVKKVNTLAKEKGVKIENKVTDFKIMGAGDRLTEVFAILLDNAIKYSMKNGKVLVSSKTTGGKLEISVTDSGIGIEKRDLPHIFDRFYRADKSRSKISGYGLGLSIAKKIVESHGGNLFAESEPGVKTTFTVSLSS